MLNFLFYSVPILNQSFGAIITLFILIKLTPESTGELAKIVSASALIFPFFTMRIDILITHEKNKKFITELNQIKQLLFNLMLMSTICALVLYAVDIIDQSKVLSVCGAAVMAGYAFQYASYIQNNNRKHIIISRTINLIIGILILPMVILKTTPLSVFILQILRNNISFFIIYLHDVISGMRVKKVRKPIARIQKHWNRIGLLWLDYAFNQASTNLIILYTSLVDKEIGGTFFIVYAAITSLNAIYSRTIGLDFVLLAGEDKIQALKHFLAKQSIRIITVCSILGAVSIAFLDNSQLAQTWPDLTSIILMSIPLAMLTLLVSSASQYYLMSDNLKELLKVNVVAGLVKVATFAIAYQTTNSVSIAICSSITLFYATHLINLVRRQLYA